MRLAGAPVAEEPSSGQSSAAPSLPAEEAAHNTGRTRVTQRTTRKVKARESHRGALTGAAEAATVRTPSANFAVHALRLPYMCVAVDEVSDDTKMHRDSPWWYTSSDPPSVAQ